MVIDTHYRQLKDALIIEDILCLSVLIAKEILFPSATVREAANYFHNAMKGDCKNCPFNNVCLACIINE